MLVIRSMMACAESEHCNVTAVWLEEVVWVGGLGDRTCASPAQFSGMSLDDVRLVFVGSHPLA